MKKILCSLLASLSVLIGSNAAFADSDTSIKDLRVQNSVEPITIEDAHPVFSWKMASSKRGQGQSAYRISVVRDSDGSELWNTGKVESSKSVGIPYQGVALQAEKSYSVKLSVWDKDGDVHEAGTKFQTGLMNPRISAWEGARWTGTHRKRLDAATQCLFEINTDFQIRKGDVASLILGADDFRLGSPFMNDYGVKSEEDYVKVEFDFGKQEIRIYRVGYFPGDKAGTPVVILNEANYPQSNIREVFSVRSKSESHSLNLKVETGNISFVMDGKDVITTPPRMMRAPGGGDFSVGMMGQRRAASPICLNVMGSSGDFPTFPNMNSVGFAALPGSEVVYTGYEICNSGQSEDKVVFSYENYDIFKNLPGVTIDGRDIIVSNDGGKEIMGWADPTHGAVPMLRSEFSLAEGKAVKSAKLYASAMGAYAIFLNGQRVGDYWFGPGDSQFRETMTYQAYDVRNMLKSGRNAIGATLFPGWYTGYMTFTISNFNFFGDYEALLSKLVVTYEDGTREVFVSDPSKWKVFCDGPIRSGSFFHGERFDASKEEAVKGWCEAGYDDSAWEQAVEIEKRPWIDFDIVARYDELVKVRETLTAKKIMPVHSSDGHTYIYDMGVNMVGVPSVRIPAGWLKKGDKVIFNYAEQVYPGLKGDKDEYVRRFGKKGRNVAGHLLLQTNRAAMDVDIFIADNSEEVTIQPSSTYRGYQYIQITLPSHSGALPLENIKGLVLSSCEIPTGEYVAETSDGKTGDMVNQLFRNIQRSQLGNFFTIPTDCPQRNERMGWTGDAQAYTRTGIYNADAHNFYRQWMVALRADQGVGNDTEVPGGIGSTVPTYNKSDDQGFATGTTWAAAVCQVPWQVYNQYGDTQIIEENIETMMNWLNGMAFYKLSDEHPYLSSKARGLADWLALDGRTTSDIVNNAIYIHMMEVTAIMAEAIGRDDYAAILRDRHDKAKADWNKAYVNPVTGKTRNLYGQTMNTQASYATPLNFNVFSDENKAKAEYWLAQLAANPNLSGPTAEEAEAEKDLAPKDDPNYRSPQEASANNFKPYTITTGFSGTPNILPALSRAGYADVAYKMFTCSDYASWLYPVTKGATSVWERWNSYDVAFSEPNANSMNSFNHFALGAVGQWMYEYQLGITTDYANGQAGYQKFVLQPSAGANYTSLEGSYDSSYGKIKSSWKADGKGHITEYAATVPANTSATLYLPVSDNVTTGSSADGATFVGITERNKLRVAEYELTSGEFNFRISGNSVEAH